jgi:His/Glu/Gln/Arg/opine family amino acid ABC transporter permease subunit
MTWSVFVEIAPHLLYGTIFTVVLAASALVIGTLAGVSVGLLRFVPSQSLTMAIGGVVEFIRAIPLLMLIFFIFFGLPSIGIDIPTFPAAILALSLWMMANASEVVRGGIQSIPPGQMEAARSTGLSGIQAMRYVVFPQAVRRMLPPYIGLCTILIKDTSLAAIIGVLELTHTSQQLIARTYFALEIYLLAAVIYFCLCYPLSVLARRVEARLQRS